MLGPEVDASFVYVLNKTKMIIRVNIHFKAIHHYQGYVVYRCIWLYQRLMHIMV